MEKGNVFFFFFFFEKQKWEPLWLYYTLGRGASIGISLMRPNPVLCEGANLTKYAHQRTPVSSGNQT